LRELVKGKSLKGLALMAAHWLSAMEGDASG